MGYFYCISFITSIWVSMRLSNEAYMRFVLYDNYLRVGAGFDRVTEKIARAGVQFSTTVCGKFWKNESKVVIL